MRILVSACLLGIRCRYDGGSKPCGQVLLLGKKHVLIPVCPEQLGGLPTPRVPAEIRNGKVMARDGICVDDAFVVSQMEASAPEIPSLQNKILVGAPREGWLDLHA